MDFNKMSNNDIMLEIKTIEQEYEVVKNRILIDVNHMDKLEKIYNDAQNVIINRIKGNGR